VSPFFDSRCTSLVDSKISGHNRLRTRTGSDFIHSQRMATLASITSTLMRIKLSGDVTKINIKVYLSASLLHN